MPKNKLKANRIALHLRLDLYNVASKVSDVYSYIPQIYPAIRDVFASTSSSKVA